MKKTVYSILICSLVIGICLMIIDGFSNTKDEFNIPARFEKVTVDLSDQFGTDVLLFTKELDAPSTVEFFIQSDNTSEKIVKIVSESEIIGFSSRDLNYTIREITGTGSVSSTLTMDKGSYSVYLTSEKINGKLVIGHQETATEPSEFERLHKIHNGEINNPPEGYAEIFSTNLTGKSYKDEVVYTLTIEAEKTIGLSVYTSSKQGNCNVDFIGKSSSFIGLIHPRFNRICDQLVTTLSPGEYHLKLTCENADGQLYIFLKQ